MGRRAAPGRLVEAQEDQSPASLLGTHEPTGELDQGRVRPPRASASDRPGRPDLGARQRIASSSRRERRAGPRVDRSRARREPRLGKQQLDPRRARRRPAERRRRRGRSRHPRVCPPEIRRLSSKGSALGALRVEGRVRDDAVRRRQLRPVTSVAALARAVDGTGGIAARPESPPRGPVSGQRRHVHPRAVRGGVPERVEVVRRPGGRRPRSGRRGRAPPPRTSEREDRVDRRAAADPTSSEGVAQARSTSAASASGSDPRRHPDASPGAPLFAVVGSCPRSLAPRSSAATRVIAVRPPDSRQHRSPRAGPTRPIASAERCARAEAVSSAGPTDSFSPSNAGYLQSFRGDFAGRDCVACSAPWSLPPPSKNSRSRCPSRSTASIISRGSSACRSGGRPASGSPSSSPTAARTTTRIR